MKDLRYKFTISVSAHILLYDETRVLMVKRPKTWEWGPDRWGITGGKVYEHENFFDAIKRKTVQELGFEVSPDGLYSIKQLLIKDKQAFMFFFAMKYKGQKFTGEMTDYKWFGKTDLGETKLTDFSEYFYKDMLASFLTGNKKGLPASMIESLDYVGLSKDKKYKEWFNGMIKKDYNPEEIADYKKWKVENK